MWERSETDRTVTSVLSDRHRWYYLFDVASWKEG